MKKAYIVCLLTSIFLILFSISIKSIIEREARHIKVGFVYIGDEMTPYTENFINAQKHVENVYGDKIETVVRYNVPEDECFEPIVELINENCDYIIAPSYGYAEQVKELAKRYPDVQFCVPTGDNANAEPVVTNYHNCMGTIYQGRYVCGVVAGMKLKEMIDQGIITPNQAVVGYVAAFPYAEVISGYTAFYLGVQSVVPEATMLVKYTNTWSSFNLEKKVAEELVEMNCVVISQHSDTTGPAVVCENYNGRIPVYHVGYNQSMIEVAPTRSLISCNIDYSKYFEQSIEAILDKKPIEEVVDSNIFGQDAYAGFDKGWVRILDVNNAIAPEGAEEKVLELKNKFMDPSYNIFYGDFVGTDPFDPSDRLNMKFGYEENNKTSAPTFHYVLDGVITIVP